MKTLYKNVFKNSALPLALAVATLAAVPARAQESPKEEDFFRIMRVSSPEGTLLEVGGLVTLPNGDLGVATRRGEVYIVENPTSRSPHFRRFATGLHEVLGLAYQDGALYCAQRGELTKLIDTNRDGKADVYETVYVWPLSGHYHEYSFGPKIGPDGAFYVTGNVAFGDEEWWLGESRVPWRGWTMRITPDGKMEPFATGMRSPAGLGMIQGELFYADNQGDWMGTGGIWHVTKGAFTGHPAGLRWADQPNSPVKLTSEQVYAKVDQRREKNEQGRYIKPENVVNEKHVTLADLQRDLPEVRLPAVWLPHGILGISNSELVEIPEGHFGPFAGQMLIGDQGQSKIMRVALEKVNGEYQGVAFDFRAGFQSGVLRLAWAQDGSLFVGETNRGWGSAGEANEGLQRLVWNNGVPFEMQTVRAMPDGFEIAFTKPVDRSSAERPGSYAVESFNYKYHPVYGSPPVDKVQHRVRAVRVAQDGLSARIVVENPSRYAIHAITLEGVQAQEGAHTLVHPTAYYTLNNIPEGPKLALKEADLKATTAPAAKKARGTATAPAKQAAPAKATPTRPAASSAVPSYDQVKGLLAQHTCQACHATDKRQVGPAFVDVAKRRYSNEQIVELIHNPKPENWPDYATPMPPMPHVPREDALKIAAWINSLAAEGKASVK